MGSKEEAQKRDSIVLGTERAAKRNEIKKVYENTNMLFWKKNIQSTPVNDKSATIIANINDQVKR